MRNGVGVAIFVFFAILLVAMVWLSFAQAAPPPGTDMDTPTARWFQDLRQPSEISGFTGGPSCCSISDCRPTAIRVVNGHYEAFIDSKKFPDGKDEWVEVPDSVKLTRKDNPMGEPVVCYHFGKILCFVDASKV